MALLEEEAFKRDEDGEKKFSIATTWDGQPVDHESVELTLEGDGEDLVIRISAPFFGDPAPEGGKAGEAFFKLWEHEVVEAFFLNDKEQYLELEFGPHGQHLMLLLNGNRNAIKHSLPMDYSASINLEKKTWTGRARVPASYFPPNVQRWNAYVIHGEGEARTYEALFESSGPQPDFHRLEKFRPLETEGLLAGNKGADFSSVWKMALLEEEASKRDEDGEKKFTIATTWDGQPVDHEPVELTLEGGGGVLPQRQGAVPRVGVRTPRTTSHAPPEWQPKCNQAQLTPGLHSNDRRGCKALDREGSSAWILFPSRRHPLERVRHSWHRRHQNVRGPV